MVLRRGGITEIAWAFCDPTSSQHHNSGGVHVKKNFNASVTQLRALANHRPIWGSVAQGALEL